MKLVVDTLFLPAELLEILHPFKVRDDYTSGVYYDAGKDSYATIAEDGVRVSGGRMVGPFQDEVSPNLRSVPGMEDVAPGRGGQDIAFELQELLV